METEKLDLAEQFTDSHREDFNSYFEEVAEEESDPFKHMKELYHEHYDVAPLEQEEDEDYIQGMLERYKK